MSSETIDYYNQHAAEYVQATVNLDMAELYAEFVPLVKTGDHILDAGCGSGRDAAYFKQLGFTVSAFDASEALATIASQRLKQPVTVQQFEQLDEHEQYDGIWCCASLLHVTTQQLPAVLNRLQQAMKPGAVLYASFKYGSTDRFSNGRHFTDLDEASLCSLLSQLPALQLVKSWQSRDQRPDRADDIWLNAIITRKPH
jgi:cyclopropane fatty-acyl-phospholipid synthase-like methyltransferase